MASSKVCLAEQARRTRIGIFVNARGAAFYERELTRTLQAAPAVHLTFLQTPAGNSQQPSLSHKLLWLWTKLDARFLAHEKERSGIFAWRGIAPGFDALSEPLHHKIYEGQESAALDVIVGCHDADHIRELLASGVVRVWLFESGSEEGGWSSAVTESQTWNVFADRNISATRLVEHSSQGHRIIAECSTSTDAISIVRQQKRAGREHASLILRALRLREAYGGDFSEAMRPLAHCPCPPPTPRQFIRLAMRAAMRGVARVLRRAVGREQWFIAVRRMPEGDASLRLQNFQIIRPPADRLYADPFVVERDGRSYVFFEELRFAEKKGRISCLEINPSGIADDPHVVLEIEHHLSYPFVFHWKGETYMMPEMAASERSCVYRAVRFPYDWELSRVAFENARIYDPTICEFGGKFWLFASGVEPDSYYNSQLHLFFADSPLGPWTAHPKNPIVFDVRRARPAGHLFWWGGNLIRPGQDCASVYGGAITLNRIEEMSERDYRETPISTLGPEWIRGNLGTHTLSWSQKFQAVDGCFWSYKFGLKMPLRLASGSEFPVGARTAPGRS